MGMAQKLPIINMLKKGRFYFFFLLLFVISILYPLSISAQSNYVLPYPSAMPGSNMYKLHLLWGKLSRYWYFGDFGQFDYSFKMSDKYLVEAKTLFEYKQYLLGYKALQKSNDYFKSTFPSLISAKIHNKNIFEKKNILKEASLKHMEVLKMVEKEVPGDFLWTPEKSSPQSLQIIKLIQGSINLRKSYYEKANL